MQEIAICPICQKQVTVPAGKIPMACPACHSNIKRSARLYVNEEGVLVRYDGHLTALSLPEAVRTVGENVFFCHTELETVCFPHGLVEIQNGAFGKCGLREVRLPDTLTVLGRNAFAGCSQLAVLSLPARLKEIPARAFEGCSDLSSVTLDGVTTLGPDAFAHCSALREASLSRELREIGYRAFFGCTHLARIVIPKGVRTAGEVVFGFCPQLSAVLCEAPKRPEGFAPDFAADREVVWGYREK